MVWGLTGSEPAWYGYLMETTTNTSGGFALDMSNPVVREGVALAQMRAMLSIEVRTGMSHSRGSVLKAFNAFAGTNHRSKAKALADCEARLAAHKEAHGIG